MKKFLIPLLILTVSIKGCTKEEEIPSSLIGLDSLYDCKPLKYIYKISPFTSVYSVQEYSYESDGLEKTYTFFKNGIKIEEIKNYQHDANGNILYNETYYRENPVGSATTNTYTKGNKCLTTTSTYRNGDENEKHEWTYNSKEWEIGHKRYKHGELKDEEKAFVHDERGNVTYKESHHSGSIQATTYNTYSKSNNRLSSILRFDSLIQREEWDYDSNDRLKAYRIYTNGGVSSRNIELVNQRLNYRYDSYGNNIYYEYITDDIVMGKSIQTFTCFKK